jgi:hypothetical protein
VAALVTVTALAGVNMTTVASASTPMSASPTTAKAVTFDDAMRALWEAHGTWTERAIVDFVGGLPDTPIVIAQLLGNQVDIGNAVKPYYGDAAGTALTKLLQSHINDAVAVLKAAKSGDTKATTTAETAFYANGVQVAQFLHSANPTYWSLGVMETMMRVHLNQVIGLATDQLTGHYSVGVALYGAYIAHLLDMADMLSSGIEQQFPTRFS